ncbi:hypothetical protein GA0070622_0022 [Micromonospora sediminicola]|uniref:Uncharacterized protein n=1 Tax=Micromonospora sediminicola TaxID=946078 RepID=A0A1A9B2D7_9ACTN|nr:hypothetical protein [Micromonospora sediminicola]SBT63082.1 hypothetical protein GA0070622_0022 [Micromonospora sediminicola]
MTGDLADLLIDGEVTGWWLYQMPDGRKIGVDVDTRRPLHWTVDIPGGDLVDGLTTEQVHALLRHRLRRPGRCRHLTRLQALTGRTEALLRAALRDLTAARLVVLRRHGEPVDDIDTLSEHARFQLHLGDGQRRG